MAGSTERGIVYPTSGDSITPLESAFATLAQTADDAITNLEPQTIQVFENTAERDAASVPEGSFCYVKNNDTPYYFDGTNWVAFTPSSLPASVITSGVFDEARIPTGISVNYANTAGSTSSASYATSSGSASSVPWSGVTSKPSTFPPSSHTHAAGDITSGTFSTARIPTITGSMIGDNTIEQGNINTDAVGPSELIEARDYTMDALDLVNNFTVDGVTRINFNGFMYPASGTGTSTAVHQAGTGDPLTRSTSSRKYKLFEQELDMGLAILNLTPKTWIDKAEYEKNGQSVDGLIRYPGFIAEDLDEVGFESFVHHNKDGSAESIDYGRLVAAIIPVLKHYKDRIDFLENKINEMGA